MLKSRIPAILLAFATLSCASPGQRGAAAQSDVVIDQGAAGSTVALRQGQKLTVSLPTTPTTGFVWQLLPGYEAVLARQGDPQFSADSTKLGAGGVYRFAFLARSPGSVPLKFVYRRSFEKETASAESFEVTVVVEKP